MIKPWPFLVAALAPLPALPSSLTLHITDPSGAPIENAVAWAVPKSGIVPRVTRAATVRQVNKAFQPLVTVVPVGSAVSFPNLDEVRHQVYSFSPTKAFEISLYGGMAVPPSVLFDKPGEVALGCNIHDNMVAYVYVVDSPYYGKTGKDGRTRIDNLPDGDYSVRIWHFGEAASAEPRAVHLVRDEAAGLDVTLAVKSPVPQPPQIR